MQRLVRASLAYAAYSTAVIIGLGVGSVAGVITQLLFGRNDWVDTGVALVVFAAAFMPLIRIARLVVRGLAASHPE
jgi:ABC-type nitrate/sulfonate/bicarbonate transport system permease component